MQKGAIVLSGGKSSRMGRDKAILPFGPETILQRTVRLLGGVVEQHRIVVVSAINQQLPPISPDVIVTHDQRPDRGPLEGLKAGLMAIPSDVDAIYVTSCDVPLLVPDFVVRMFELLDDAAIVVPCQGKQLHPLAAVYRPTVLSQIRQLLEADRLRLQSLFDEVEIRAVPTEELFDVDPQLHTLANLNTPAEYQAALRIAGYR